MPDAGEPRTVGAKLAREGEYVSDLARINHLHAGHCRLNC